eukprot:g34600.t1
MKCFKRFTADAIILALHLSLKHLDNKYTYIRLLLINYSSTFNAIIPSRLISKLRDLGLSSTLCNWILSFLTYRPQSVRIAWYGNCSAQDHKKLQEVVCTAQTIMAANFPSMDSIHTTCCHRKAAKFKDPDKWVRKVYDKPETDL